MTTIEASIRGLPEWLISAYLEELGARHKEGDEGEPRMSADDWSVSWTSEKVEIAGGSLRLTQFDMVFSGEAEAVAAAHERFMKKAQRGGG